MPSIDPSMAHPADYPGLSGEQSVVISRIYNFVQVFFKDPKFDASHDFRHVLRVTTTAINIYKAEKANQPGLDLFVIILGALLHDVEDKKYAESNGAIRNAVLQAGLAEAEAVRMQRLAEGVSYSSEVKDPEKVKLLVQEIPELAVVQDADRLDALGAIGIGRCIAFGAAKGGRELDHFLVHFEEKLYKLESMMKTETGRKRAQERSRRLHEFEDWWESECWGTS